MEILISILSILVFYVSVSLVEGVLFHLKAKSGLKIKYQHFYLVATRVPLWILFYLVTYNLSLLFFLITLFPLIHDGTYYWTRNKLNPNIYPKKFWDNPDKKKSDAILDFSLDQRIGLAFIGTITLIISLII